MTIKPPRVPEKVVQQQVRHALLGVGATVYTIGRPPRRDATYKGTGQTPGIPDLLAHLPASPTGHAAHQLWIEVKAKDGRLRAAQASFRDFCLLAGLPHLVGGLDVVLAYLLARGYLREISHYRRAS